MAWLEPEEDMVCFKTSQLEFTSVVIKVEPLLAPLYNFSDLRDSYFNDHKGLAIWHIYTEYARKSSSDIHSFKGRVY